MALVTETITNPTGAKLLTAVENALATNANWSFVEEVVLTTYTHRVWLCEGSETYPFYLILSSNTASTATLYVTAAEQYDPDTNATIGQVQPINITSYATGGARPSQTITAASGFYVSSIAATGTHTARVFVEDTCVLIGLSGNANCVYAGLFDSAWHSFTADEYPLCVFVVSAGSGAYDVAYSRVPGATSGTVRPAGMVTPHLTIGIPGTGVNHLGGDSVLGLLELQTWEGYASRGYAQSMFRTSLRPTGAVNGDTITDGDDTYMIVTGNTTAGYFIYLMRM